MIQTINENQFIEAFRILRPHNFTISGLKALYEHFEELGATIGEIELDVISHCCDYSEFENLAEIQKCYPDIETIEQLRELTEVIPIYRNKLTTYPNEIGYIIKDF